MICFELGNDLEKDWDKRECIQQSRLPAAVENIEEGVWDEPLPRHFLFPCCKEVDGGHAPSCKNHLKDLRLQRPSMARGENLTEMICKMYLDPW